MQVTTKKPVSMPDAFVILFFVMIAAAIASHIIPAGYFQMLPETVNVAGETVKARIDPNSFQLAAEQNKAVPLFGEGGQVGFLNYAFEGLVSGDKMGAAIGVIQASAGEVEQVLADQATALVVDGRSLEYQRAGAGQFGALRVDQVAGQGQAQGGVAGELAGAVIQAAGGQAGGILAADLPGLVVDRAGACT